MENLYIDKKFDNTEVAVQNEARSEEAPPGSDQNSLKQIKMLERKFLKKILAQQYQIVKSDLKKRLNPRSTFEMGNIYFARKIFSTAKNYYLKTISLDSNFIPAYHKLFIVSLAQGKLVDADKFYKKILELSHREATLLHNYVLFKIGNFPKDELKLDLLIHDLQECIDKKPDYYEAINSYGFVLLNLYEDIAGAETFFKRALSIKSDFAYALNNLGVCKLRTQKYEEAEHLFRDAQSANPAYTAPYENLVSLYVQNKKFKSAVEVLETALKLKVKISKLFLHALAWLYIELGSFTESINWYKKLIINESDNELLLNNLGHCQRKIGEIKSAENTFREAVKIVRNKRRSKIIFDNRSLLAFYNFGRILVDQGKSKELKAVSEEILDMNPEDAFGKYLLGSSLLLTGKFDEAKDKFTEALSINLAIIEVYPDLSFLFLCIERDYLSAVDLLENALKLNLKSLLIYNNLAVGYIKSGQLQKASKLLSQVDSNEPVLLATRGLLAMRKDDLEVGNKYYQQTLNRLNGDIKTIAQQIWLYEQANFCFRKQEYEKAILLLKQSKKLLNSYVNLDIVDLETEILKVYS